MSNYLIDARLTERKVNEKAKEGGERWGKKEWNWRDGWEVGTEERGRRKDEMEGRNGWEEWTEERGE